MCTQEITVDCGYENAQHGYCYPCASIKLDEILSPVLPPTERHLKPSFHTTVHARSELDGLWVQAQAMGCVRPYLARAFAAAIIRCCDEAERRP